MLDNTAPAPLEPLNESVDERNVALLNAEIERRIKIQRVKLTRKELLMYRIRLACLGWAIRSINFVSLQDERRTLRLITDRKSQKRIARINKTLKRIGGWIKQYREIAQRVRMHRRAVAIDSHDNRKQRELAKESRTWEQQILATFRQMRELHHAGEDKNGRWFCDTPQIDRIYVKPDAVYFRIETSRQNMIEKMLGRWQSALPYGVHVTDMISEKTLANLSAMCKRTVKVERSTRGHALFYVISRHDAPNEIPAFVPYASVVDYYPVADHQKTPWAFGLTRNRELKWFNFDDYPHVLVAGTTQGGKSNLINQLVATIVTMNTPDELEMVLVDLKGGIEFTHWKTLPHLMMPVVTTPESTIEALDRVKIIMDSRLALFEAIKAKNLSGYRKKSTTQMSRVVVLVDEMATLIQRGESTTQLHNLLRVLSSQGRAVGIHLVLCTQHSSVDVLPGWVKTNMYLRISTRMPSASASIVILDTTTAASLPDIAGRAVASIGRNEVIAQVAFISEEEIERAIRSSSTYQQVPTAVIKKADDFDIVAIALEKYDGQLSANKIFEGGGIPLSISRDMLRKQINAIVDEAEVKHGENRYLVKRKGKAFYLVLEPMDEIETMDRDDEYDTEPVMTVHRTVH